MLKTSKHVLFDKNHVEKSSSMKIWYPQADVRCEHDAVSLLDKFNIGLVFQHNMKIISTCLALILSWTIQSRETWGKKVQDAVKCSSKTTNNQENVPTSDVWLCNNWVHKTSQFYNESLTIFQLLQSWVPK